jgi:KDO2-lipid IV(A) lauroyltransferase
MGAHVVSRAHDLEAALVRSLRAGFAALPFGMAGGAGAALGDLVRRAGVRVAVARDNLALAFPDRGERDRGAILAAHYRHLGQMLAEYTHPEWVVRAPLGEVIAVARGLDHLETVQRRGRGAILLTGHYGSFALLAGWLGRLNPVDIGGKPLENPAVESVLVDTTRRGGIGRIRFDHGARRVFTALRENHWVALMADQDAGRDGAFVPFFGRSASTWLGPASISLRTGAPLVMAFITRRPDGRHEIDVLPPLDPPVPATPDTALALTALHTATLEHWVRREPAMWFWLHRRWKSRPRDEAIAHADEAHGDAGAANEPLAGQA